MSNMMNNGLDSPVEALLGINHLQSYGALAGIDNIWAAWITFITGAAISFWIFRAHSNLCNSTNSAPITSPKIHQPPISSSLVRDTEVASSNSSPPPGTEEDEDDSDSTPTFLLPATQSRDNNIPFRFETTCRNDDDVVDDDGTTRGKFSVYYYDTTGSDQDDQSGLQQEEYDGGCAQVVDAVQRRRCDQGWEAVLLSLKMQEFGWYRYQDLTVLDGNVVRLWDDCKQPRRRHGGGAVTC